MKTGINFGIWMVFTVAIGISLGIAPGRHEFDNFIGGAIMAAPLTVVVMARVNRLKRRKL